MFVRVCCRVVCEQLVRVCAAATHTLRAMRASCATRATMDPPAPSAPTAMVSCRHSLLMHSRHSDRLPLFFLGKPRTVGNGVCAGDGLQNNTAECTCYNNDNEGHYVKSTITCLPPRVLLLLTHTHSHNYTQTGTYCTTCLNHYSCVWAYQSRTSAPRLTHTQMYWLHHSIDDNCGYCPNPFTGPACDKCMSGYYGPSCKSCPNCQNRCTHTHNTPHATTPAHHPYTTLLATPRTTKNPILQWHVQRWHERHWHLQLP